MSQVTGVKQELTVCTDSFDDTDCPEVEDEKLEESAADEEIMQWALRTLQRTEYLSDLENEEKEEKKKCAVRAHRAKAKRGSKNQISWKDVDAMLSQFVNPGTDELSTRRNDTSPPAQPFAVTLKEEPPLSSSAASQDAEDPLKDTALAYMDWCGGDTVPKPSTTPPPHADLDVVQVSVGDTLEEKVSACPVAVTASPPDDPLAVTTKEEPPLSSSAASQDSEEPINVPAFKAMDWCGGDTVVSKTEWSTTPSPHADMDAFAQPIEDPLGDSVSACPVPVTAPPPDDRLAITTKEEPPLSASAAVQNADEPINVPAFKAMDWYGGDAVVSKTEWSTTPSPYAEMDAFDQPIKDPLEESVSACPMPVSASAPVDPLAVTTEEEHPPSPSAAAQNAEDILKDAALAYMDWCGSDTISNPSTTPPLYADVDELLQSLSEESIQDALASLQMEWVTPPTAAECIVSPSGVIRNKQFLTAVSCASAAMEIESDGDNCTEDNTITLYGDEFSSVTSVEASESALSGDNEEDRQKKDEALRMKELICSGDVSEDVWNKFLASVPPPRFPTTWKVRASTPQERARFHKRECRRFGNPKHCFVYWLHGYESVVGPVNLSGVVTRDTDGRAVRITDTTALLSLTVVRDTVARLPNGVGSLEDILVLLSDSQFSNMVQPWRNVIIKVKRMLSLLNWEDNPCLRYSAKRNVCIYLHRGKSKEELETLYQQQPNASEARNTMESHDVREIQGLLRMVQKLITLTGPPLHPRKGNARRALASHEKRVNFSDSGPQPVCSDPKRAKKRRIGRKLLDDTNDDGSALVRRKKGKKSSTAASTSGVATSATAPTNQVAASSAASTSGVAESASSSSGITLNSEISSLPSTVSAAGAATTLADRELLPRTTLSNGVVTLLLEKWNGEKPSSQTSSSSSSPVRGVVPSDARVPNLAASVAVEDNTAVEGDACDRTTIDFVTKVITKTGNGSTAGAVVRAAAGGADLSDADFGASLLLVSEGICAKCYGCFRTLYKYIPRKACSREGGPSHEVIGEVSCSMCDVPSFGLGWIIVKQIVTWWVLQCKWCKRRYGDQRQLRCHEKSCAVRAQDSPSGCSLCIGYDKAMSSLAWPLLFRMHLLCPVCGQLFTSLFNLGVYPSGNGAKRVNLRIRGLSCFACGLQMKVKRSLNAHMKTHKKLSFSLFDD